MSSRHPIAADYLGRRYRGQVPCFRFVADWLRDRGMDLPAYDYETSAHVEALRVHLMEHADPAARPIEGDVALMDLHGQPAHIGIMLDGSRVMHHISLRGVVIERVSSPHIKIHGYWRPRLPASPGKHLPEM